MNQDALKHKKDAGLLPRPNYYLALSSLTFIGSFAVSIFTSTPPHFGQKKSRRPFSDSLLGVPLCGRRVFSCKSSGKVDPM